MKSIPTQPRRRSMSAGEQCARPPKDSGTQSSPMKFRRWLHAAVLGLVVTTPIVLYAQAKRVVMPAEPSCPKCTIELRESGRLGGAGDTMVAGRFIVSARDSSGRWYSHDL